MWIRSLSTFSILAVFVVPALAQERVITTIAGADWLFPGNLQPAVKAPLGGLDLGLDVAVDHTGHYYICDGDNRMVMRVGSDGIINVIAGNGLNFNSGDGGLAVNAGLRQATSIAVDLNGNVYIGEYAGDVRKVTTDGIIHTIAGTGNSGFGGDNGPAIQAQLYNPAGLAVDSHGNLYISDSNNNRIRKVTTDGIIHTVAGNGQAPAFGQTSSGDGGPAAVAQLNRPSRIALDPAGNLYITETQNQRVRKVAAKTGIITTFAGGGLDPSEGVPATSAPMFPVGVAADSAGNVYIADLFTESVRRVDAQGNIHTVAGGTMVGGNFASGFSGDGGPALQAVFHFFFSPAIAVDPARNVFVADDHNSRIRKIDTSGTINTIAGNGLFHFSGNGGTATSATLESPTSVVADNAGNIYITEMLASRIRRVTPDGRINTFAGTGAFGDSGDTFPAKSATLGYPTYFAFNRHDEGALYFADAINGVIRRIDANGIITTIAGAGIPPGFSGDGGPATRAMFDAPYGIDFDNFGDLAIADSQNNRIRAVLAVVGAAFANVCTVQTSCVVTLAGNGTAGYNGDNQDSRGAQVNNPIGLRVYIGGLYFADNGNNLIRRIDINTLNITTVAGTVPLNGVPQAGYAGDGGPATQALLNSPQGIAFDSLGNMYIADEGNSAVRKVDTNGNISTFVGSQKKANVDGDGGPISSAGVAGPTDIFVDSTGRILIADSFDARIRAVLTTLPSFHVNPSNLAFTAQAGSTPVDQALDLEGSIPGVPFSASASSSGGWLQVSPASGVMPTTLRITADPSQLAPADTPYSGTITVTAPNANPSTQTINVALSVTAPGQPSLSVKPSAMTFSFVQKTPASSHPLSVSNVGGGSLSFTAIAATVSNGAWLKTAPASATVNAFGSTTINITVDPSNLSTGTYSGTITVASTSPAQSIIVPVTLTVTDVLQTILIPQTGLTFFAVQGGGKTAPQVFDVLNTGSGQMSFNATASTIPPGGSWLSVFPPSNLSDANSPVVPEEQVAVDPGNLTAGIYYGTVQVSAPKASNTPQFVSVILNVLKPGTNIGPLVQPTGLIFTGVAGAESPGSQTVTVQNTSGTPVTVTSGRVTSDGNNWFTSLPADGIVTQTNPINIVIQPQIAGLAPNIYRGTLTLSFSDGNTRVISLVLVIVPAGTTLPSAQGQAAAPDASCTPTKLAPVFTMLPNGFNVPGGFPAQVNTSVVDDCGHAMTAGGVTVSFSNGDPALPLTSLKNGTWAGTWIPGTQTANVTVTALAQIPEQNLKGQVQIKGGVQTSQPQPVINPGGTVSAATSSQTVLSPGSLISIYGSQLAQGEAQASSVPLPKSLAGSTILLAGRQAPLFFASSGQINAVVPYGISVNTSQQVSVSRNNAISVPQPVSLAAAGPGIFTTTATGQGQGAILKGGTPDLADTDHPVKAKDVIVIFCTGLGEVQPPVVAGEPASKTILSRTIVQPDITVGGVSGSLQFSGLAPGFVGLYQVNVGIPEGVQPGDHVPVVITAAGQRSNAATIAVR